MKKHISEEIRLLGGMPRNTEEFVQLNDAFFVRHKIARYVVNSLRVYEFFGLGWRMPLWDNELAEYWYAVEPKKRSVENLYEEFLLKGIFARLNVALDKPRGGRLFRLDKAISRVPIARNYRSAIKRVALSLRHKLAKSDINAFDVPTRHYLATLQAEGMKKPSAPAFINIFPRWYLWSEYKLPGVLSPSKE